VGGGIVIDGKVFRGSNGFAAEVGHMLLQPGQPAFQTDDKRGEVEQFISGTAIGKRLPGVDPQEYFAGAGGEALRPQLFREIAWFVTTLTYLLDPSIIIFGGSAGMPLRDHFDTIRKELQSWTLPGTPLPLLAVAQVADAGIVGAALAARAS
jgi:glucokinase